MKGPSPGWTVLVTGASSGLGRALACELARVGCSLVLTGRDGARLEETKGLVKALGAPQVSVFTADLATPGGPEALVGAIRGRGLGINALVNNAGAGRAGAWTEGSTDQDRDLVRLLVDAPLVLTRAFLPSWREKGWGALLNVASTGAFQPGPQTALYYAAKAFLMNWSVALAREERGWLAVTTLCPGALKTGFSTAAGKLDVPGAPGPERTARVAIQAWRRGRGLVVPGGGNKVLVFLSRLAPVSLTAAVVERLQLAVKNR